MENIVQRLLVFIILNLKFYIIFHASYILKLYNFALSFRLKTRPDTRLPKSHAGGQGPYLRSPDHLGGSSEVKEIKS